MAEILPIRRKSLSNQPILHTKFAFSLPKKKSYTFLLKNAILLCDQYLSQNGVKHYPINQSINLLQKPLTVQF